MSSGADIDAVLLDRSLVEGLKDTWAGQLYQRCAGSGIGGLGVEFQQPQLAMPLTTILCFPREIVSVAR